MDKKYKVKIHRHLYNYKLKYVYSCFIYIKNLLFRMYMNFCLFVYYIFIKLKMVGLEFYEILYTKNKKIINNIFRNNKI